MSVIRRNWKRKLLGCDKNGKAIYEGDKVKLPGGKQIRLWVGLAMVIAYLHGEKDMSEQNLREKLKSVELVEDAGDARANSL